MKIPMKPAPTNMTLLARFGKFMPFAQHKYFSAFIDHICGGLGPLTITDVCRWASFIAHYTCFRDFLLALYDDSVWLAEQWHLLNDQTDLLTTLPNGERVLILAGDDTINKHPFANRLFGVFSHHNHAAHPHEKAYVKGENAVLIGCVPAALSEQTRAFIMDDQLYRPVSQHDPSGEPDLDFVTRLSLLEAILEQNIEAMPKPLAEVRRIMLMDSFFTKEPMMRGLNRQNTNFIGRLQKNRVMFKPAAPVDGKRGRPAKYGERFDYRAALSGPDAKIALVPLYGRQCKIKYVSEIVWLKGYDRQVKVVVSQLIDEPSQPIALLVTDRLDLDSIVIIRLYSSRFSLEEAIKDARLVLGWGSEAARKSEIREKWRRLAWIAHGWMSCLARHQPAHVRAQLKDPWRKKDKHKTTLGEIRQGLLVERITGCRILVPFGVLSNVEGKYFLTRSQRVKKAPSDLASLAEVARAVA